MRWNLALLLLGIAITILTLVSLKGGESMPLLQDGSEAGIGKPFSDMHHSNAFETATFALG